MLNKDTLYKLRYRYEECPEEVKAFFKTLSNDQIKHIASSWAFTARINQLPPPNVEWQTLLWLCGRGFGKTRALCEWVIDQAMSEGGQRIALVGRTAADVRDILVNGEAGLIKCANKRGMLLNYERIKRLLTFPNGSICQTYTAEQPDQLRGVQFHHAACDELAAWQYDQETWDMLLMTLRLGEGNKIIVATTPQPTPLIKKLIDTPKIEVVRGSTFDNKDNLSETYIEVLTREYEGTRLGRQELYGEVLLDTPGALWQWKDIRRVDELPDDIIRTVVAVDPAVTNNPNSDETGICVAAKSRSGNYYIIDDLTLKASPLEWGKAVCEAYQRYKADRVIYEANQGGDLVAENIRVANRTIPIKSVRASKGKYSRAEPIAALYEQGKVYHVKEFKELEDQMSSYNPQFYKGSPDRLDALVWALHELKGQGQIGFIFT